MKLRLLITGATGFIGSFLVDEALAKGYEVYAAIRPTSNTQFLTDPSINFIQLDLSKQDVLENQFRELVSAGFHFDYVIHNAGITGVKKGESFYSVNFGNTKRFADALLASGMRIKKFILTSSLAAYGPGDPNTLTPIRRGDRKRPVSDYGKSKLLAEEYIASLKNLPYIIINPTGVYGPRDKAFLQFVQLVRSGWEPYIGRNRQMISLIYVKDLAKVIIALLPSWIVRRSFLVGDGHEYDKEEMGDLAKEYLDKKTIKIKLPVKPVRLAVSAVDRIYRFVKGYPPFLNREKIDEISQPNWLCDSSEIWQALDARPQYDLESGLKETIHWYQEQRWL